MATGIWGMVVDQHPGTSTLWKGLSIASTDSRTAFRQHMGKWLIFGDGHCSIHGDLYAHLKGSDYKMDVRTTIYHVLTMALMNGLQMYEEPRNLRSNLWQSPTIRATTSGNLTRYVTGSPLSQGKKGVGGFLPCRNPIEARWTSKDLPSWHSQMASLIENCYLRHLQCTFW